MRPFSQATIQDVLQARLKSIKDEIDGLEADYVLKASSAELQSHYCEKARVDPLVLDSGDTSIEDQHGTRIDVTRDFHRMTRPGVKAEVQGTRVVLAIPYAGDKDLWKARPSTFTMSGYPDIEVLADRVTIRFEFPDDSADAQSLRSEIDREVASLDGAVETLQSDVRTHNASVEKIVAQALKRKVAKAQAVVGAVAGLGIPIKRREEPLAFVVPTKRRASPVSKPKVTKEPYKPEPVLPEDENEHILGVLRSMSVVIERSPDSFAPLDEEAIRHHFLLQLNGHYDGGATGETFNSNGKTDILIRYEGRNVFIAECKFWRGQKSFNEAIDQLLRYLSWRDCKCALLVFNRQGGSTAVREKMHVAVEGRPEHRRTVANDSAGESRYILVNPDDPGKEIHLATLLFDVPTSTKKD